MLSDKLPIQTILRNLGLQSACIKALFLKILESTKLLFLSKMTHKAVLEVDENGMGNGYMRCVYILYT